MLNAIWRKDNYSISTDKTKLDHDLIHKFLTKTYWANARTREQVDVSIRHSYCFGVYHNDSQIGFARLITDFVTFGYLADVFIVSTHQKQGLGKWLIEAIVSDPIIASIQKILLLTNDAQGLYKQFNFNEFPYPERVMMR